jgi:predicted aldo/keto reductase-like oxidoreductase
MDLVAYAKSKPYSPDYTWGPTMSVAFDFRVTRRNFLVTAGAGTALASITPAVPAQRDQQHSIPLREFGKTGVKVPIVGVGTAPAGFRGHSEAAKLFGECLDRGLNYFDTAPEFAGYGKAQVALGDVLKMRRQEAFVVTKCWEPNGEKALALLKENLRELQTDHADVVYAHSIGADNMDPKTVLGSSGILPALARAQRDGLVRFIGVSGHNRPARFLRVLREFEVQVMMIAVNFVARHIYRFETEVWPEAQKQGVALVAMKVYGGVAGGQQQPKGARIPVNDLHDAFRYAQGLPGVATVVLGLHDGAELKQSIDWATNYTPLDDAELSVLLARGKKLADQWGEVYGPVA